MGSCGVGSIGMGNAVVAPASSAVNCAWACANCARFAMVRKLGPALGLVGVLGCFECEEGASPFRFLVKESL
jgi:hypothetical protein